MQAHPVDICIPLPLCQHTWLCPLAHVSTHTWVHMIYLLDLVCKLELFGLLQPVTNDTPGCVGGPG
jgi:hypothetical protein